MTKDNIQNSFWWERLEELVESDSRGQILAAAYKEIHRQGFQAASISNILAQTGLTKGALYHHFPNKTELGYAVIDEIVRAKMCRSFIEPLKGEQNPIDVMTLVIKEAGEQMTLDDINLGCPMSNLAQEMAPIDEGFRLRIASVYDQWRTSLAESFARAQARGEVLDSIDPKALAVLLVATLDGCMSTAKTAQSLDLLLACGHSLITYLQQLRCSEEGAK